MKSYRKYASLSSLTRFKVRESREMRRKEKYMELKIIKNITKRAKRKISSVQFSSVAQSCPTLCDPMDCSTPGFPVHHQLPEPAQTRVL